MDDELIMYTLAQLMTEVRWRRTGDTEDRQFITVTRRIKLFADVPTDVQPWIGQAEHGVTEAQVTGMPYKTVMEANWFIMHAFAKDKSQFGSVENNLILKGVRDALAPKVADRGWPKRNTLGGLVHHCHIGGRVFKDPGDLDDQALMIVPIKVLVP